VVVEECPIPSCCCLVLVCGVDVDPIEILDVAPHFSGDYIRHSLVQAMPAGCWSMAGWTYYM
jgi:hypothetical protein